MARDTSLLTHLLTRTYPLTVQGAAAYWLHHSLLQLQHGLRDRLDTALVLRAAEDEGGDSAAALLRLARESGASAVHYNAAYEPWRTDCDQRVSEALRARGVAAVHHRGNQPAVQP